MAEKHMTKHANVPLARSLPYPFTTRIMSRDLEITSKIYRIDFDVNCHAFKYESSKITCDGLRLKIPEGTPVYRADHKI